MASGISNTFRIGGLAVGVAALGAIFEHRIATGLQASLGGTQQELAKAVASGGTRAAAALAHGRSGIVGASLRAFADGLNEILMIGAGLVLIGALAAIALVRLRDLHRRPAAGPSTVSEAETVQA